MHHAVADALHSCSNRIVVELVGHNLLQTFSHHSQFGDTKLAQRTRRLQQLNLPKAKLHKLGKTPQIKAAVRLRDREREREGGREGEGRETGERRERRERRKGGGGGGGSGP